MPGCEIQAAGGSHDRNTKYSIDISGRRLGSRRSATVVVTIHDTDGQPVTGATVEGTWSGDYNASVNDATDEGGQVSFTTPGIKVSNAKFTFTVDDVIKSGYTYDQKLNLATSATIVVP